MLSSRLRQIQANQRGFALISVLALVSLAALTATAFLASARLERQATRPLGQSVQLEWALASGEKCAEQMISDSADPSSQGGNPNNFVTTIWRGPNAADWTNELGYLFIGQPRSSTNVDWVYFAGFSSAGFTDLVTNSIQSALRFTNAHQGTFLTDCGSFMNSTNGTNGFITNPPSTNTLCTRIELLGGQTSPPVGWVYLTQRKRLLGSTNEVTSPVARIAWFIEDLAGKIDAESMGALSASGRPTGTNPEEISLGSLVGTNGQPVLSVTALAALTNTNNRKLFFTPGQLAQVSGLTNTNDLRYFAAGLREFRPTTGNDGWNSWIPCGIPIRVAPSGRRTVTNGYSDAAYTKFSLNQLMTISTSMPAFFNIMTRNIPDFTNRAGGMNGTNYLYALAANIVDYADTDSSATQTNVNGILITGFDNYPMLTHIFDQFTYSQLDKKITNITYLQFWNPSTLATTNLTSATLNYNLNDRLCYQTNTDASGNGMFTNVALTTAPLANTFSFSFSTNTSYSFPPNGGFITSFTNVIDLSSFPNFTSPPIVYLNATGNQQSDQFTQTNFYTLTLLSTTSQPAMTINRYNRTLNPNVPNYIGSILGLRVVAGETGVPRWRTADPRMTPYLGAGTTCNYEDCAFANTYFQGYPAQDLPSGPLYANPMNWADGNNSANNTLPVRGSTNVIPIILGPFQIQDTLTLVSDTAPCKISNKGAYTNICELGNIFDPLMWAPPTTTTNYANCNITTNTGSVWTTNNLYGGGSTLRIGRPEHSLFAFTNFSGNSSTPIPNMGQSAAALLDLFDVTNGATGGGPYRTGGKINLNTAPAPVLRALAGGVTLTNDAALGNVPVPTGMAEAFAQGVMRFRSKYPFLTPSHLCFIGTGNGWPNNWPSTAVFGNDLTIPLNSAPGNSSTSTSMGVTGWTDALAEEWFSKIYQLSGVSSENYRVYVVAQLVDSNKTPISPLARKYVQFFVRNNTTTNSATTNTNSGGLTSWHWAITKGCKKAYESTY